jgi:hypothetical protein
MLLCSHSSKTSLMKVNLGLCAMMQKLTLCCSYCCGPGTARYKEEEQQGKLHSRLPLVSDTLRRSASSCRRLLFASLLRAPASRLLAVHDFDLGSPSSLILLHPSPSSVSFCHIVLFLSSLPKRRRQAGKSSSFGNVPQLCSEGV